MDSTNAMINTEKRRIERLEGGGEDKPREFHPRKSNNPESWWTHWRRPRLSRIESIELRYCGSQVRCLGTAAKDESPSDE